jgi:ankyrin repeat protein
VNPEAVNAKNDKGETPLHIFLDEDYDESEHLEQFKILVTAASKENLCMKDSIGCTLLSLVCDRHTPVAPKTVLTLLRACPAAAALSDDNGEFPIQGFSRHHLSISEDIISVAFEALLAASGEAASVRYEDDIYLLHSVALDGTLAMLKLTFEVYPEAIKHCYREYGTPLHLAILRGSVGKVAYLHSLYPEAAQLANANGCTLLHFAVESHFEMLRTVYSYFPGAIRLTTHDNGRLPLHDLILRFSCTNGANFCSRIEMLRFLLKQYPESARVRDTTGFTPYEILSSRANTMTAHRLLLRAAPEANPSR